MYLRYTHINLDEPLSNTVWLFCHQLYLLHTILPIQNSRIVLSTVLCPIFYSKDLLTTHHKYSSGYPNLFCYTVAPSYIIYYTRTYYIRNHSYYYVLKVHLYKVGLCVYIQCYQVGFLKRKNIVCVTFLYSLHPHNIFYNTLIRKWQQNYWAMYYNFNQDC